MAQSRKRVVCQCNGVTETEILRILKKGAKNVDEVSKITLASTGCGRCKGEIIMITNSYLSNKKPDIQRHIDF